ncbi:MAG: AAA family ATPase [Candidatus Moranbacteria bacterium CG_4_8_14_3_um_filter_41_13]|nr:MAG: AAA family ATPase [Candidatus Moranbacteria bacterium CG2_30_41_165]PIP25816.1 MAG: AAA family ATPase [Candidatus Moranbacteria bacterium CG23_combo_of_CG06-09_8_20_14_all_41_28]PIW94220.1 MAG: AAA family ATPase [Candidatus Moranbacteria bacterium CG_4_8_14_3_um_filter_41_13]PJC00482.1 MAG: AAA family ATPase [Candidatus Moranbacteria bacterium CG_4_9_14_0_8_um_filter_41_43]HCJ45550.1 AAA family ATPase [Candidatus Moranbacteria bacterium]
MSNIPLAERMRPQTIEEFLGQEKVFGEGSFLRTAIKQSHLPSLILWGPPGSGKTTLARILSHETEAEFVALSAVSSGKKDLQAVLIQAKENYAQGKQTILFLDEIHRWNKSQQDALLPFVESGELTLIGATTENPSFEVNSALLSRSRVLVLEKHTPATLLTLLRRAVNEDNELKQKKIEVNDEALTFIAEVSGGDGRQALNILEICSTQSKRITSELVGEIVARSHILYDKGGEEHYNIISALHKSMRGGDADASLYWLGRMLEAGEDPLYVARRLVRFASEDIGIANSFALPQAVSAFQACQMLGMPECEVHLAQAVVYLALSKKSNALYTAYNQVKEDVRNFPNEPVPMHLRNAPTKLMKEIGYGKAYKYTPDFKDKASAKQEYLPEKLRGKKYLHLS